MWVLQRNLALCSLLTSVFVQAELSAPRLDPLQTNESTPTLALNAIPSSFDLRRIQGQRIDQLSFVSTYLSCIDVVHKLSTYAPLLHLDEFNNGNLPTRSPQRIFIGVENLPFGSHLLVRSIIWALAKIAILNPESAEDLRSMGFHLTWQQKDFALMIIKKGAPKLAGEPSTAANATAKVMRTVVKGLRKYTCTRCLTAEAEATPDKLSVIIQNTTPILKAASIDMEYTIVPIKGHNVLAGLLFGMTEIAGRNNMESHEAGFSYSLFGYRFQFDNQDDPRNPRTFYHSNHEALVLIREVAVKLARRSEGYFQFTALFHTGARARGYLSVDRSRPI